jgi:hypothetical protein
MRRLVPIALALSAASLPAQSIFDSGLRVAPQYIQYRINAPINEAISEFAVPIFLVVPITSAFSMDVGTAYASSRVENTAGPASVSHVTGLTDTQVRANLTLGTDFIVLTGGVNLPTGRALVTPDEQAAATLIGSDFLAFPIASLGTGFGFTGGIAIARPVGDWNFGIGASVRQSSKYDPFQDALGARFHFQPGNEYRGRVGVDRPVGNGRFAIGVTYSTFGDDNLSGSTYNTGNRLITQGSLTNSIGSADVTLAAWNLYRASGTIADGTALGFDNVANLMLAVGFHPGGALVEPSVEVRNWQRDLELPSTMVNFGLRSNMYVGPITMTPSLGYTVGKLAGQGAMADMTGFKAVLAFHVGQF